MVLPDFVDSVDRKKKNIPKLDVPEWYFKFNKFDIAWSNELNTNDCDKFELYRSYMV